jgi:hypothetical protein
MLGAAIGAHRWSTDGGTHMTMRVSGARRGSSSIVDDRRQRTRAI